MLSIYKRGEVYHIRGTVSYAGETRNIRRSTGQTIRRQAEEVCRAYEQRILNEMRGGDNLTPFFELAEDWVSLGRGDTDIRNALLLSNFFKDSAASEINTEAWNLLVRRKLKGCSNSHINRVRATLVAILNHASVTIIIPRRKELNDRVRFLSYEDQEALLASYPEFIRHYFITICYQGFRRQEALNLKRQGVNFESNTIQLIVKGGKLLTVPMHPRVREALLPHIRQSNAELVFLNKAGKPYSFGDSLKGLHTRACKKAGINDFTIHDWRHHFASRLMMAGADLNSLMKLGGWESEKMVFRYASVSNEHTRDTLEKLK